jgi:single-stranded DNA-binding protein
MIDPRNLINITGGVVSDAEMINDNILKFRLAVDYAGSEKGSDNTSGYFDVVYYLKDKGSFVTKNASFMHSQVTSGKMKKGAKISIVGRLVQERWRQDDANRSRIVVVAEHIAYAPSANGASKSSDSSSATASAGGGIPDSF